jgi:hypothetical protein
MPEQPADEVPEGAAVFPLIPPELGVHPLLLALLHATVFLAGSEANVVDAAAAEETLQYMAACLKRLGRADRTRVGADIDALVLYAKKEKWPKPDIQFLKSFLTDYGLDVS